MISVNFKYWLIGYVFLFLFNVFYIIIFGPTILGVFCAFTCGVCGGLGYHMYKTDREIQEAKKRIQRMKVYEDIKKMNETTEEER